MTPIEFIIASIIGGVVVIVAMIEIDRRMK